MFNRWMTQWLKLHCAIKNHLKDFIWNRHKCPWPIRFNISLKRHGSFANLVSESARDKAQQKSFINFVTKTLEFFYKNWTWEKRKAFSWKYPECMFESLISTVTHLAEVFNKMHNSQSHRNTLQNNWEFLFFLFKIHTYFCQQHLWMFTDLQCRYPWPTRCILFYSDWWTCISTGCFQILTWWILAL